MYNSGFYFEIHDLLTQFIAAMDDVVIGRYNKNREEKEQIKVRYIHAPKERLIYDLVNKAQNITVPAISINVTSIARDETRIFNKIDGFYCPVKNDNQNKFSVNVPMPIPVNVGVAVNIITNYQSDLDQIISNFVPYSNPYIIISWKIPDAFNVNETHELRSKVMWDGSINVEYPTDVSPTDKFKFIGKTNFTIEGWLFPEVPTDYGKNIFFIDANFRTSSKIKLENLDYSVLSTENQNYDPSTGILNETETVSISASPYITNIYQYDNSLMNELSGTTILTNDVNSYSFLLVGKNFDYTNNVLISSNNLTLYNNLTSLNFTYFPTISGFLLPKSHYNIIGKNMLNLTLSGLSGSGNLDFIITNQVGWKNTNSINSKFIYIENNNKYFYSNNDNSWYSLSNWYDNFSLTKPSLTLPQNKHDIVIMQTSIKPYVNLDDPLWIQPNIINSGTVGITFNSDLSANVSCFIIGDVTFLGNSTYNL